MINKSLYIDRIRETENLTDELVDSDARWLFDWGIGKLDLVLQGVTDEADADERVSALMACMRKINRFMSQLQKKDGQTLVANLGELASLFARLSHKPVNQDPISLKTLATRLKGLSSRQALEFLAQWGFPSEKDKSHG